MNAPMLDPRGLEALATSCGVSPEHLLPELYQSLRRMAHRQLLGERDNHSLDTTALVHEVWLKLVASYPGMQFAEERDFLALSGHLMRRVLIDHARHLNRLKYGGKQVQLTYTDGLQSPAGQAESDELLALDLALAQLQHIDARQVQIVELRYFAGFSIEETAELLALSPATIKREWAMARAWLVASLQEHP
jgi:RNA polymerase sigma factor (TIGR02999 family)